jgi:DNA-binding transcriptional MerR regulator/methylmalonyl-CoA mutase cobalamin-binding subunit
MLGIGALSRATAIPVETLRTWERRYGYPVPDRTPSGQRVYPVGSVARLRRIAEALASGHRASAVVAASDDELRALLAATPAPMMPAPTRAPAVESSVESDLLAAVRAFDAALLTRRLQAEWARLGPLGFLEGCVGPIVREVGAAWAEGRLEVRHEHFLSERVSDVLRALRLPYEERAAGPLVILTSLPGEPHSLGLHMAGLVVATNGCRVLQLGPETPLPELQALARDLRARAVGISVSAATGGAGTARRLRTLRAHLPKRTALLVGGEGAPHAEPGITAMHHLSQLDAWARQVASAS